MAFQGTTRCNCHVYLWKWTDKVVISDIDGTITKSDVLGHVLPIISMDWAQYGVASLFNKIRNNGYQIAYLSARAIGQAPTTKKYLESVSQEDLNLPGIHGSVVQSVIIVTSSTIDIFFEITKFSKILSKFT